MPLRSPGLILKRQEMEKGGLLSPNSFHTKSGINGSKESTSNSPQGKTFTVFPYLISSEKIHQVLKTVKTGIYKSFIKQVLLGTFLPDNQEKFSILSIN